MSVSGPSSAQLAVLYEHPQWFQPLFAALDRHCLTHTLGENRVDGRIAEYEDAARNLLLLQMSPQSEEMERFASQVVVPMRAHPSELL